MNTITKLIMVIHTISNFHIAVLDRLGLLKGTVVYRIRGSNIKFHARTGTEDLAEIAVVSEGSEYDLSLVKVREKPVIVDLGGHIGTFSISAAQSYNSDCKVYTFEPDPENFKLLTKNIKLNKLKTVFPHNLAISDFNGTGELRNDTNNSDAFYLDSSKKSKGNCEVKTLATALKKYKIDYIDLLKMDIEGGEYSILLDSVSLKYLEENVHYVFMEYHILDKMRNLNLIKKIIKGKFRIINTPKNVLVLENTRWLK